MLVLLGVLDQRGGDGGVIRDESAIVSALPQERSQSLEDVRNGPILDD